jgi:ADP-ribosylglycohydrolase
MASTEHAQRMERARLSLEGLSIGDAFGECFFFDPNLVFKMIRSGVLPGPPYDPKVIEGHMRDGCAALREVPALPPWKWTDDTALAVVQVLSEHG